MKLYQKILIKGTLLFFFILSSLINLAQTYYTYALNDKNRRFGSYNVNNDLVSAVADTISALDAKSFIALNAVRGSKSQAEQNYVEVRDFILLIENGKKSKTMKSVSDQLTPEMRTDLQNISSGTTLTFKEISLVTYDSTTEVPKQTIIFIVR